MHAESAELPTLLGAVLPKLVGTVGRRNWLELGIAGVDRRCWEKDYSEGIVCMVFVHLATGHTSYQLLFPKEFLEGLE